MTSEARLVAGAINYWKLVAGRADRFFSALTEEQLLNEVAPGKNRLIYLPGHLTAVHDAMFSALGVGERLHPELDAVFLSSPDKTVAHIPSGVELQAWWKEVNEALLARFTELPAEAWLQKHTLVSESDFEKEPDRNRLAILLSRTNHASFHLGQAILAGKIPT